MKKISRPISITCFFKTFKEMSFQLVYEINFSKKENIVNKLQHSTNLCACTNDRMFTHFLYVSFTKVLQKAKSNFVTVINSSQDTMKCDFPTAPVMKNFRSS